MEIYLTTEDAFNLFLKDFVPKLKEMSSTARLASWELETTGSKDAAIKLAMSMKKLKVFFSDSSTYQKLLDWKDEGSVTSPENARILKLLLKEYETNQVPKDLLEKIAQKETDLSQAYVQYRAPFEGKLLGEQELLELMKTEKDVERRKRVWEATKTIGPKLAPMILELVKLRNEKAHRLGYPDYYQMELKTQETEKGWLLKTLEEFAKDSQEEYNSVLKEVQDGLSERFNVSQNALGAWAWADPFCQEDPLAGGCLDDLVQDVDIIQTNRTFYQSMGFEIDEILERSDLFGRENKNQHAFCTHIDQEGDIRMLTNLRPTIRWLETLLHELGHAVYEQGYDPKMNWLLKAPPHMITTEAIALLMGRCAYDPTLLETCVSKEKLEKVLPEVHASLRRRQLIFSRWVLVMTHFEASMYQNPEQDLNQLWWSLVQKYQKICVPSNRSKGHDWACKYHVGLAPVYYHSYLLGEFFASMLKAHFNQESGVSTLLNQKSVSTFLNEKLFSPGNSMPWDALIQHTLNRELTYKDWVEEFKS